MYIPTCFFTALIGFERMEYDVSEHEDAWVCMILMNGVLIEDITLEINSHRGTAGYIPLYMPTALLFFHILPAKFVVVYLVIHSVLHWLYVYAHKVQCTFGYITMCIQ